MQKSIYDKLFSQSQCAVALLSYREIINHQLIMYVSEAMRYIYHMYDIYKL